MLIDTSGFFCLLHRDEPEHDEAVRRYSESRNKITHNYVLDEFVALATARKLPRAKSIEFSRRILNDRDIRVVWIDRPIHIAAIELLEKLLDKTYSLCDAVSFVLMREFDILDALTTDHHFEQEGFVNRLK